MMLDYEKIALDALTTDPEASQWWNQAKKQAKPYDVGGLLTMLAVTQAMKVAAIAAARAIRAAERKSSA